MRTLIASGVLALSLLAGCGGVPTATPKPAASPQQVAPKVGPGTVLTEALSDAQCVPGAAGDWTAHGTVENTTDKERDFEVLIYVGPVGGDGVEARVVKVDGLAAGKSAEWQADGIKPASPTGPCFIRARIAK